MRTIALLLLSVLTLVALDLDPAQVRRELMRNPNLHSSEGELLCWHARIGAELLLDGYEASGDARWLDEAAAWLDWWQEQGLRDDPDGWPGTIGAPVSDGRRGSGDQVHDTVVGDALLGEALLRFVTAVRADPQLAPAWGARAQAYQDLVVRMCWEKWNQRDCYVLDRLGHGSYRTHGRAIARSDWTWIEAGQAPISDNLNKHYQMGLVLLQLWRLSGEDRYRQRVLEIFGRAKALWRLLPDDDGGERVAWNFWMPHGPGDLQGSAPRSWVGVHPQRPGYQAGEVAAFVTVYDHGLVFDERDLRLMVATNRWMLRHDWAAADGSSKAGTLWSALARFDPELRAVHQQRLDADRSSAGRIRSALFARREQTFPDWQRRAMRPDEEPQPIDGPLQPGAQLIMVLAIPDTLRLGGEPLRLVSRAREAGELRVELLDASGDAVLATLAIEQVEQGGSFHGPTWDGSLPDGGQVAPGRYLLRWNLNGEQRRWPLWVEQATPEQRAAARPALARGQTLRLDFAAAPDPRWQLRQAEIDPAQLHEGQPSLRIRGEARFDFGSPGTPPVAVTMWVWDNDAKHGRGSRNGPAWGIRGPDGNHFAIRILWRPYLDGDREYAWLNSGENQYFSPHRTRVARRAGWRRWDFDFRDPAQPIISCDGIAIPAAIWEPRRFLPANAEGLLLLGGGDFWLGAAEIRTAD